MTDLYQPKHFDPLSTEQLTAVICVELERQVVLPLVDPLPNFRGSGLYAIYYRGVGHPLYGSLAQYDIPVYAGQARSHDSATGQTARRRTVLRDRINKHRQSIDDCDELVLSDFGVRLLLMPDVHADLGENGLRVGYKPVWNAILTGFGSNEQGASTRQSARTKWDTVHPGRRRSAGHDSHDRTSLIEAALDHIESQIVNYSSLPWRRIDDVESARVDGANTDSVRLTP